MRVFLDTNILVSAFTTRGICADIVREVLLHQELLVCSLLLNEVRTVLTDKFNLPGDMVSGITHFLSEGTIFIEKRDEINVNISDKDDITLLGYALNGRASVFVTGDRELKSLKKVRSLRLISPREYWDLVRKKE